MERWNGRLLAELHLHLGGAILPRILYVHLRRKGDPFVELFDDYEDFEAYFRRPRRDLAAYLKLHELVERVQRIDAIRDFVRKIVRGAYLFEDLCYVELRYTPWFRTDAGLTHERRIAQMAEVVAVVAEAAGSQGEYPLALRQILCMHSTLGDDVNRAIVKLAAGSRGVGVVAVDIAGPETLYGARIEEMVGWFRLAKELGLRTTGHLYETVNDCHPELLPWLDRIGHGIQIPLRYPELLEGLARRGQCLEVCPTSYLKTGTLARYEELRPVFERCAAAGVDVAVCTDNSGLHMVRLPNEYENLLIHEVIDFATMLRCREASFRHAFDWAGAVPPPTARNAS